MTVRSSAILASHPVRMCVNNRPGACMRAHSDAYLYLAMLSTCYSSAAEVQVMRESPHGSRPAHHKQPQSVLYSVQQVGMATPGCGRDGAAATAAAAAAAGAGAPENDQDLDPRHSLVQVAARQLARAAALAQAQQQVHIVHLTLLANTSYAGPMSQKAGAVTESCVCRLLLMSSQWARASKWCRLS